MELLNTLVSAVNNVLWSYVLIVMLVGLGLWFSFRTGFVQIRHLREMVRLVAEGATAKTKKGHISTFQAFCVSTASRVGVGNIAGIAIAVVVGGPGAVFWMWVIALLGAATGFVESTLAQIYKVPRRGGGFVGGPAYYIGNALGSRWGAWLFAVLISVTYGLIFNSVQANTMALSLKASFDVDPAWTGLGIAVLTGLVIFGGLNRIARVVGWMVPLMAGAYLLLAAVVTVMNITLVPEVLLLIVKSAFGVDAVTGAAFGMALMTGIKRGLFSNEAGMGSAPNAAATADVSHPAKQGLVQMLSVFIDTLLICSSTALMCLCSGVEPTAEMAGAPYVQAAMQSALGSFGPIFIAVSMALFAFTTLIGNYYYCEGCLRFIFKRTPSRAFLNVFRIIAAIIVMLGAVISMQLAWDTADLFQALMVVINVPVILILSRPAFAALGDYVSQRKQGREPAFKASDIGLREKTDFWN